MTHGLILLLSANVPGLELEESYSDEFLQDCTVIKWRSLEACVSKGKNKSACEKLDSEKRFILQGQVNSKKCISVMKWFLFRSTSRRMYINWYTLGLVIFFSITEAIWELFSQGDIFKLMLYSKEQKKRGLRHPQLSLSSVISAGALDKQEFTSLMWWVQINTLVSEAHWVFTHPFIVTVLFSHGQFVLRLLCQDCHKMLHSLLLKPARYGGATHIPPALLTIQCHTPLQSLPSLRDEKTQYLPASLHWAWLETKIYKI